MNEKEIVTKIKESLKLDELGFGISANEMAEFIEKHHEFSPLKLVYKTVNNGTESDYKIHKDLSNLIGFELFYMGKTFVIFTRVITNECLQDTENATIGELRTIAKQIYPNALPINNLVASLMWGCAQDFYTMKYILMEKGIELSDIRILSSVEPEENDNCQFIEWYSFCELLDYLDGEGGGGEIKNGLPVWCYIETE